VCDIAIGPYQRERIVLCSGDASPRSQRNIPGEAGYFFPKATWVGATRNSAERLNCRFVIFAGPYGLVDPWEIIAPFNVPGHTEEEQAMIRNQLALTIPHLISNDRYDVVVFYAGANPRDIIIEMMLPILEQNNIDMVTFGKPNTGDLGKLDNVVELLINGTTPNEIMEILRFPGRLQFFIHGG
jgi:hypothetical protein